MGVNLLYSVKFLPDLFQQKYRLDGKKFRTRVFECQSFFWTMVALVSGCNGEGYLHALSFTFYEKLQRNIPSAAAFSKFRSKISYQFFKDAFTKLVEKSDEACYTIGGLRVYAIDGQSWILPRTQDIVDHNFTGRQVGPYKETYMPRGYLTHLYDVVTGVSKAFTFNPLLNEHADAKNLLQFVEKKSLVIYDRLFFSYKLMNTHFDAGNYFLIRCKSNANKAVLNLLNNKQRKQLSFQTENGNRVYLIKMKIKGNKTTMVFATNLPKLWREPHIIGDIYRSRWEVEISFKELTATTKGEQWHSKTYNGILQELYTKFWIINFTKLTTLLAGQKPKDPFEEKYRKANFKLIFNYIRNNLAQLWNGLQYLTSYIKPLLKISTQTRKKWSRWYKCEIKSPRSPYKYCKTGWNWKIVSS